MVRLFLVFMPPFSDWYRLVLSMYLDVRFREIIDQPEKQFRVLEAKIFPSTEVMKLHPEIETGHIDDQRMNCIFVLKDTSGEPRHARVIRWNDLSIPIFRDMGKEKCAAMEGNGLWAETLVYAIENMTVKETEEKLLGSPVSLPG